MKPFLGDDFLLDSDIAAKLYHDVAATLPIIDYHNHLPASEIANDRKWDSLGKFGWRAIITNGVPCDGPELMKPV